MVRLLVRRRHRHPEPDAFRHRRHRRHDRQRLVDRPLRARGDRRPQVAGALVHVVAACRFLSIRHPTFLQKKPARKGWGRTKDICDKDPVELGRLQQLRQFRPMLDVVEAVRFVLRVAPQAWRLVAAAFWELASLQEVEDRGEEEGLTHLNEGVEDEGFARARGLGGRHCGG